DLPRSAWILERPDARGAHADDLPALSYREQAPGNALRQGPDHHQQEQPDVRQIVRELPLRRAWLESPIGPVLHAVVEPLMRRFAVTTVALLGLAAPSAPLAEGAANPRAPPPTPAVAQPAAAVAADASRSLFEESPRQFLIGGRFTSVDGDPARYQRYQDQRERVLVSHF